MLGNLDPKLVFGDCVSRGDVKDSSVIFELIDVIQQGVRIQAGGGDVGETVDTSIRPKLVYEKFENRAVARGAPTEEISPDD